MLKQQTNQAFPANHSQVLQSARKSGDATFLPPVLLSTAWLHFLKGDPASARAELDEAWGIAERGPMRLHMANIHLYRARLFFREKVYPWESPQADLAAAEILMEMCV